MLSSLLAAKVVRFESKWIASLSLFVRLSLAVGCIYLMCQPYSYQKFDSSPISAVTIKVKPSNACSSHSSVMPYFRGYNCTQSLYDVNDFIIPAVENSAITIITRMTETEHVLRRCDNTTLGRNPPESFSSSPCSHPARCILPPFYRREYEDASILRKTKLCWSRKPDVQTKYNYQALDYILFIEHFVEFPLLGLVRHNLLPEAKDKKYLESCEYDTHKDPFCPRFRILKILKLIESNESEYESMFYYGSLIEIKISWQCNLDRNFNLCKPQYQFKRRDYQRYEDHPYQPGSTFLTSRHFFRPNDRELHRVHTEIYNLHIIVSVTGEVGKFDLFQTTTSIGSFLGIFGTGTIVCDLLAAFFTNFKSVKYESR